MPRTASAHPPLPQPGSLVPPIYARLLRMLLQHKLVKVTGRADVPGRPLQYGTTPHFLERFGLHSLKDLPSIQEFKQLG